MAKGSRRIAALSLMAAVFVVVAWSPRLALAQSGIVLSTSYPGVTAMPGDVVTFSMDLKNDSSATRIIDLEVSASPEGWQNVLKGGGRQIHQAYLLPNESGYFTLETKVPADVAPGTYKLELTASSAGSRVTLPLEVKIDPEAPSSTRFVVGYPVLRGPSEAEYEFRVTLANDSKEDQMFSLSSSAPAGWQVTFKPSYEDKQIASISVKANSTEALAVRVKPPRLVKAGEYPLEVLATGARASASTELKVVITGTYQLDLSTPTGRLSARALAGRESAVMLLVSNNGSADLHGVSLSSSAPSGWAVTFEPDRVDLPAGESVEVQAKIKPDGRAIAGDYVASIYASSPEAHDSVDLRVTVQTSTLWGLVGILIVALVAWGVLWVFRTYGRR